MQAEIGVIGGGFAGSLTAILLSRIGRKVVLLEQSRHPRFRIGESSTPTADMLLRRFAERYDVPELAPLSRYGSWRRAHPELRCGLKRGFSYVRHPAGRTYRPSANHANELLVTASSSDDVGDTHWLRADVDQFLFQLAQRTAHAAWDGLLVERLSLDEVGWKATVRKDGELLECQFAFLIDASGGSAVSAQGLGLVDQSSRMRTCSRAIYSHFHGVRPWTAMLQDLGACVDEHPFDIDAAAQHHVLDEGWMWALRFDRDLTSIGFVLDAHRSRKRESVEREFGSLLQRYPSVAGILREAKLAAQPGKLVSTSRLQRRFDRLAGRNWALLPGAAGFVDPLHSTGIAHSLYGVARIVALLNEHATGSDSLHRALRGYQEAVGRELDQIDRLVFACYAALPDFGRFCDCTMLYFAAAHTFETRCSQADRFWEVGDFLLADDPSLTGRIEEAIDRVSNRLADRGRFRRWLAGAIRPFNTAGLCDPAARNMYRHTAAE